MGAGTMGSKVWLLLAIMFFSHALVLPVMCGSHVVEDQKTYYPPGSSHRHSGKSNCPTPSGGSASRGGNCKSNCPTPSGGSASHGGSYVPPPSHSSSGSITVSPPSVPLTPTPIVSSPPILLLPDPNIFTGTCDFWRTHPQLIWSLLGCWGPIGTLFGLPTTAFFFGSNPTVPQALANTRTDGFGALLRQGAASYLNSLAHRGSFPLSTQQVRERFTAALVSEKAAAEQARQFELANEGHLKKN